MWCYWVMMVRITLNNILFHIYIAVIGLLFVRPYIEFEINSKCVAKGGDKPKRIEIIFLRPFQSRSLSISRSTTVNLVHEANKATTESGSYFDYGCEQQQNPPLTLKLSTKKQKFTIILH
jgi:hypothetical protein